MESNILMILAFAMVCYRVETFGQVLMSFRAVLMITVLPCTQRPMMTTVRVCELGRISVFRDCLVSYPFPRVAVVSAWSVSQVRLLEQQP